MEWDKELADLAELNVKKCDFEHDCHNTPRFEYSGQNLYMSYFTPGSTYNHTHELARSVENWYDEIKESDASKIKRFEDGSL